jgi:hypothetical protein
LEAKIVTQQSPNKIEESERKKTKKNYLSFTRKNKNKCTLHSGNASSLG